MHRELPEKILATIGIVVIGRNEGARLRRCLASVRLVAAHMVYVDSGSSDGSVKLARDMGVEVVELDATRPFCAARARNMGYAHMVERHPELEFIQFVDGDCELNASWLPDGQALLRASPRLAIVAGRLRERSPEASIYNRIAELEWNLSGVGEVAAVGGIFMIRRTAFESVGGFDESMAAGEEPELCRRLADKGWSVFRTDRDMARHDLAMTRFGQWWTRSTRYGYTSLESAMRFGMRNNWRSNWRIWFWAAWLALSLGLSGLLIARPGPLPLMLLAALWPAQWLRITLRTHHAGHSLRTSMAYAFFLQIAFLPQASGQWLYCLDRLQQRSLRLLEYRKTQGNCSLEQE